MSHLRLIPKKDHFIRDVFTDFLLSREVMLCSPKTLEFSRSVAVKLIDWLIKISISNPEDILSNHVRSYLSSLKQRNLADNMMLSHARAEKTFHRFCHQEEYIPKQIEFNTPRVAKKSNAGSKP